jgi:tetratricopeptide (TPR) repeat protein
MLYRLSTEFRTDATGKRLSDVDDSGIELAARHYRARDYAAAAVACDAILLRQPRHFDALHLRGVVHLEQQRPEEALEYLRRAEKEQPDQAQLQFHIGNALLALQRWDEAETAFRRSLALRPGDVDALNNLGNALSGALRHAEAMDCFRQALAVLPNAPPSLYNLGRALVALDRLEEAVEQFRAAFAFAGADIDASRLIDLHNNLSEAFIRLSRYDEALAVCRGAPASIADAPRIQWNASLTLLMLGDYAEGWRKYECRFLVPEHDPPREGAAVLDLNHVAGQRVLVFPEQGRGDMIQFARYLPLLAARGAHVEVEMYADLKPLFDTIEGCAGA